MTKTIKIGTRGSALALVQAEMVCAGFREHHPDVSCEIVEIRTSGDWKPEHGETRLSEADGGKGLFAKEIEAALIRGDIDCAVHSMKDMPAGLPDGLILDCVLPRADVRDAVILNGRWRGRVDSLDALPKDTVVATSSTRRAAFVLNKRPDLSVTPIRGNVPTRIDKVRGQDMADATILAYAGLERLRLQDDVDFILDPQTDMIPAACQGAVCIEVREEDRALRDLLKPLNCPESDICAMAERAALQILDGSCKTPIGAYAMLDGQTLDLVVAVLSLDGTEIYKEQITASVTGRADAIAAGAACGRKLKQVVPDHCLTC